MAEEVQVKAEAVQAKTYKVMPSEFTEARFKTNIWAMTAKAGTPYEAIKNDTAYWAHIMSGGKHPQPNDIIQVHAEDMSFYAELYVVSVDTKAARVRELRYIPLDNTPLKVIPPEYDVEWAGPHHRWRVVRVSDKSVIEKGFASEAEARLHAIQTNKKIAA